MTIELSALTADQEIRQFFFYVTDLETGFDFLNSLVEKGEILLSAKLTEDDSQMSLPVKAFDGVPSTPAIGHLKTEWISSLATPYQIRQWVDSVASRQYKDRLCQCEQRIIDLELSVGYVTCHIEKAKSQLSLTNERITARSQSLLKLYKVQLKYAHLRRRLLLDSLYPVYV